MILHRVIPTLLIKNRILYKGKNFKNHIYVGDPINAVKIYNEKEVDELLLIDILATRENSEPDHNFISEVASECFMPLSYGGGIKNVSQIEKLLFCGVEKVSINSSAIINKKFVREASENFGSSTIIVSIDVKKNLFGKKKIYINSGKKSVNYNIEEYLKTIEDQGAGEIILTNIDHEGTYRGYDLELLEKISKKLTIPLIINGGASNLNDFKKAINLGASAVAAGNLFTFQRKHNAVLITYPNRKQLDNLMS